MGKREKFRKETFIYTPSRSVSLLSSVLIFQTAITGAGRSLMSRYFLSFMQCVEEYLVALKDFDYSCSLGYKRPNTS